MSILSREFQAKIYHFSNGMVSPIGAVILGGVTASQADTPLAMAVAQCALNNGLLWVTFGAVASANTREHKKELQRSEANKLYVRGLATVLAISVVSGACEVDRYLKAKHTERQAFEAEQTKPFYGDTKETLMYPH